MKRLESILSDFRFMFNSQNFALFQALSMGLLPTPANIHPDAAILVFAKVKWDADAVAAHLIGYIQGIFDTWVYVYDETQALKTGDSQWGLHFFRNFSYQRHVNQSKFHYGHEFGALGLLCATPTQWLLFPVWVKLIVPQRSARMLS